MKRTDLMGCQGDCGSCVDKFNCPESPESETPEDLESYGEEEYYDY
jgi:hypothetical protein